MAATNLLNRQFDAPAPNQRWIGDATEFVIGPSGTLYLAAVVDLFSRFVVGWAVSAVHDRHLAMQALEMALTRRSPSVGFVAFVNEIWPLCDAEMWPPLRLTDPSLRL